jgi:transcriptional regulator GlxA family with amidase domain
MVWAIWRRSTSGCNAIALIKTNFGSKLTLAQLAKATDLSLFHFSRLFHAAVGMAPCQYLWAYRLYRARLLLSVPGPGQSIGEVSAECGFADQTHLSRRFRQAVLELSGPSARTRQLLS